MKNISKTSSIAVILMLTFVALANFLPTVNAADLDTFAFLTVAPNPVGVGQTIHVAFWLNFVPPTASGAGGDRWEDMTVTITKPDLTTETKGPFTSDPVGGSWFSYTPEQVGTYTFQMSFPGQRVSGVDRYGQPLDNYYKASTTPEVELTVQQDHIEQYPDLPLPGINEYWERPIDSENRNWGSISGNWLQGDYNASGTRFNPFTKAPNTAHILWTEEVTFGGLVGGEYGTVQYYEGLTYESKWGSSFSGPGPIIMNGRLYRNILSDPRYGFECIDIRTGETLWWKNSTQPKEKFGIFNVWLYPGITCGQILDMETPNQKGGIPYLWSMGTTKWSMYDAFTGNWILDIENITAGAVGRFGPTVVYSSLGEMLVYMLDGTNNRLAMWNSTKCIGFAGTSSTEAWQWRPPLGATLDFEKGWQWNVAVPDVPGVQSISTIGSGVIYARASLPDGSVVDMGYDTENGQELWTKTRGVLPSRTAGPNGMGVYTEYVKETMTWYGYDVYTGEQIWGPTEAYTNGWGMYSGGMAGGTNSIAYDKLLATAYDGMIHCYDINTGEHLWDYSTGNSGFETPYGTWPFAGVGFAVADGKAYACTGEHSPSKPFWRGEAMHCVDVNTGDLIWKILGWWQGPVIADGYLLSLNGADNRIYCFGKGKTETTITAPDTGITFGSSVMIRGTVTDQSPGADGTPAIADEYMTDWMQYLYMQKLMPKDATGVKVKLTAIDPNGNYQDIGEVTADLNGNFGKMWIPPVPGEYHITATFEGSESYWSSDATTYIGVTEAPSPSGPIEPEPTEAPIITTEVAIIAAIAVVAVVGIVAFWALRKRK